MLPQLKLNLFQRRTKTTERPRPRSSDINDVLKSSETDDLLTSLLSAFSSEKEEEQERRQKPSRRDQNKLNKVGNKGNQKIIISTALSYH